MDIERRSLLKGLAAGLAGAVVVPDETGAEPHELALLPAVGDGGTQVARAPGALLDEHQRRTLDNLANLILPGAVAAGTVDLIDRVASVESSVAQRRLLNAIGRFEQEARSAGAGRWLDLDDAARHEVLTRASKEPPAPTPPPWQKGQPIVAAASGPRLPTLRDDLDYLKSLIGNAYASTEAGMKALGWTGQTSWRELPVCTHADPEHK